MTLACLASQVCTELVLSLARLSRSLFYVFIIFIITKFGENFEDKIIICHILKDMTIEIKQAGAELGQAQYEIG